MLRFTEEEFQAFSERRNKGRSRPKTKKDPFLSLAPVKEVSPHAKALAALAKNPDLRDGNCEHFEQVFIFDYFERKHPDIYELLHATPNGGKRSKATAGKMKAEGQKKHAVFITACELSLKNQMVKPRRKSRSPGCAGLERKATTLFLRMVQNKRLPPSWNT